MKLLVTGAWKYTDEQIDRISSLGYEVFFMQDEKKTLPILAKEVDAVICNSLFQHHDISDFTSLKYIQLTSAGYPNTLWKNARRAM